MKPVTPPNRPGPVCLISGVLLGYYITFIYHGLYSNLMIKVLEQGLLCKLVAILREKRNTYGK